MLRLGFSKQMKNKKENPGKFGENLYVYMLFKVFIYKILRNYN